MARTSLIIGLLAIGLVVFLNRKDSAEYQSFEGPVYDLKPLEVPVLKGAVFEWFMWALNTPPISTLVLPRLYSDSGWIVIRKLANKLGIITPTFTPSVFPTESQKKEAEKESKTHGIDFISSIPTSKDQGGFHLATIEDYAHAFRNGKTTPLEVAQKALELAKKSNLHNPPLYAFVAFQEEETLKEARASTERFKAGKPLSILDGVPYAVKEEFNVAGYPTTIGSQFYRVFPSKDAEVVSRLRNLGSVLIGKTNMHELGLGVTGYNPHFGTARNPYNISHHTGGSSSGSAAAVAAGIVPFALGGDAGGSIRMPAGFCGLSGLKATFGRFPVEGMAPLSPSLGHAGAITLTARDSAIIYMAFSGPNPREAATLIQPAAHVSKLDQIESFAGLRIGIYTPYFENSDPLVVKASREAIKRLEAKGAKIVEIEIPHLDGILKSVSMTIATEMLALANPWMNDTSIFARDARLLLTMLKTTHPQDYISSQKVRTWVLDLYSKLFEKVDIIATPTSAIQAPPIPPEFVSDAIQTTNVIRYTGIYNFNGLPSIAIPVGYGGEGNLPFSLMLASNHWEEATLLRVALFFDTVYPRQKPQLLFSTAAELNISRRK